MSDNNNLQDLFDSFGSGLKNYIQDEVKSQVAQAMSSMDVEEEEVAVVGSDDVAPVVSNSTVVPFSTDLIESDSDLLDSVSSSSAPLSPSVSTPAIESAPVVHKVGKIDVVASLNDPTLVSDSISTKTEEKKSYSPGISGLKALLNRVRKVN